MQQVFLPRFGGGPFSDGLCHTVVLAVAALLPLSGRAQQPTYEQIQEAWRLEAAESRARFADATFEEFRDAVYLEPFEGGMYIVDGDTPIANEKLLREYYDRYIASEARERGPNNEFAIGIVGGLGTVWSSAHKHALSYCVSTSFGNRYTRVVTAMEAAAGEWESAADVSFIHVGDEDENCTAANGNVLFNVTELIAGSDLGRAFPPNSERLQSQLLIHESALSFPPTSALQLVGVLRHELGHVLGARHEHVRPDSGSCFQPSPDLLNITDYDRFSVMHYPRCGGDNRSLRLSPGDRNGVACVYGPADGFEIDTSICTPMQADRVDREVTQTTELLSYEAQALEQGEEKHYPPILVESASSFRASIEGIGDVPGDADLYLKFDQTPAQAVLFDCRPYESDSDEVCDVDVPASVSVARLMVHGFTAARYRLSVRYVPARQP